MREGPRLLLPLRLASLAGLLTLAAVPAAAAPLSGATKAYDSSGFTVIAMVTTDRDWLQKWNTRTPGVRLNETDTLHAGDKATLVVFFSNAMVKNGRVRLTCDAVIHDGTDGSMKKMPPTTCFEAPSGFPRNAIVATNFEVNLALSAKDKPGLVRFDIGVSDGNRHVRLPVELTIKMDPDGNRI